MPRDAATTVRELLASVRGDLKASEESDPEATDITYLECGPCRVNPGSPVLCEECLRRRSQFSRFKRCRPPTPAPTVVRQIQVPPGGRTEISWSTGDLLHLEAVTTFPDGSTLRTPNTNWNRAGLVVVTQSEQEHNFEFRSRVEPVVVALSPNVPPGEYSEHRAVVPLREVGSDRIIALQPVGPTVVIPNPEPPRTPAQFVTRINEMQRLYVMGNITAAVLEREGIPVPETQMNPDLEYLVDCPQEVRVTHFPDGISVHPDTYQEIRRVLDARGRNRSVMGELGINVHSSPNVPVGALIVVPPLLLRPNANGDDFSRVLAAHPQVAHPEDEAVFDRIPNASPTELEQRAAALHERMQQRARELRLLYTNGHATAEALQREGVPVPTSEETIRIAEDQRILEMLERVEASEIHNNAPREINIQDIRPQGVPIRGRTVHTVLFDDMAGFSEDPPSPLTRVPLTGFQITPPAETDSPVGRMPWNGDAPLDLTAPVDMGEVRRIIPNNELEALRTAVLQTVWEEAFPGREVPTMGTFVASLNEADRIRVLQVLDLTRNAGMEGNVEALRNLPARYTTILRQGVPIVVREMEQMLVEATTERGEVLPQMEQMLVEALARTAPKLGAERRTGVPIGLREYLERRPHQKAAWEKLHGPLPDVPDRFLRMVDEEDEIL